MDNDKKVLELASENAALKAERDQLAGQVAQMRGYFTEIYEYWNGNETHTSMRDACWHNVELAQQALSATAETAEKWAKERDASVLEDRQTFGRPLTDAEKEVLREFIHQRKDDIRKICGKN